MTNERKYQGVAIIKDPSEGHCSTLYGAHEKRDYDLDVQDGRQPCGRPIIKAKWLDNPTDFEGIGKLEHRLFQDSYKR